MKNWFVVLGLVKGDFDYCAIFDSEDSAFDEAEELATLYSGPKAPEWVSTIITPAYDSTGNPVWTFLDTSHRSVKVVRRQAITEDDAPAAVTGNNTNTSWWWTAGSTGTVQSAAQPTTAVAPPPAPVDDPFDPELPAGWSVTGRPLKISDVLNDPTSYQDLAFVSDNMIRALVCARISKRPNYKCHLDTNFFSYSKDKVLEEIKDQTDFGNQVVDFEIEILEDFINNNAGK